MYTNPSGNNPLVYFFVYLAGSYLSGVSGSGSWNPATWSGDVWKSSFLWPLQAVNGVSWSSNGSIDVYYTSGGSGTVYDPGAIAAEQMYYAWETGFYEQLTKHMRYYTRYYDEETKYYCMGGIETDATGTLYGFWLGKFVDMLMSASKYSSVVDTITNLSDVVSLFVLTGYATDGYKGYILEYEGLLQQLNIDNCNWNLKLAEFNIALGTWMRGYAAGKILGYNSKHFNNINNALQQARDEYYNYLYSVTNPHFVPGIDFHAEDLYYIDPDLCN